MGACLSSLPYRQVAFRVVVLCCYADEEAGMNIYRVVPEQTTPAKSAMSDATLACPNAVPPSKRHRWEESHGGRLVCNRCGAVRDA